MVTNYLSGYKEVAHQFHMGYVYSSFCIRYIADTGTVTDLTAVQTGFTTVCITWTASPSTRYQVTVVSAPINETVSETSYTATLQPGNHTIVVRVHTQHYPSMRTSVDVTVNGN